jgi:hypothetical protein
LELSEDSGNGVSWSWTGPGGFTSNQQNPLISDAGNANAGDYTVEITVPMDVLMKLPLV